MVREEALEVQGLVLVELARGLVSVAQEQEWGLVALEWELASCRWCRRASIQKSASSGSLLSASGRSPDTASKKEGLEVQ